MNGAGRQRYSQDEITRLLREWSDGDPQALDRLIPLVIDEVREMARRYLAQESPDHTLQPTALVNEVYLRLTGGTLKVPWKNRAQFFGFLADLMRRILVDHARRHLSAKRGGGKPKISLDGIFELTEVRHEAMVALDDALRGLAVDEPRQCRIVELKFFVGLGEKEIARELETSHRTVAREWQKARLWLLRELSRGAPPA